jgi:hypothetical protein
MRMAATAPASQPAVEDIRDSPAARRRQFEAGNYTAVAASDVGDDWRTWASRGLIAVDDGAAERLAALGDPDPRFFAGACHWIGGRDAEALRVLERVTTPAASRLAALIRKPRIDVLAQLSWTRGGPQDLLSAAANDSKFRVVNVSFHPEDVRNRPYADVREFCDPFAVPDFYVCQMLEWHLVPPNIHDLTCPVFAQTSDYDLHVQAIAPWLEQFDGLIVLDTTEWNDVRRLSGAPVCTFPKSFGVADALPPVPDAPRHIDVFVSGTLQHPYNPDKAELATAVLQASDLEVLFLNGFLRREDYLRLLGRSRASYVYVRRPGSTPTRGLEALAMGCLTVVQKGSVMSLVAGEREGLFTYDGTSADLVRTIRRALAAPRATVDPCRGAAIVRRDFSLSRVASQYLRFLTIMAALTTKRAPRECRVPDQRRTVWSKGWLPGDRAVLEQLARTNEQHWEANASPAASIESANLIARELVLEHGDRVRREGARVTSEGFERAMALLREGIRHSPDALVLQFNLVRAALHFGSESHVSEALDLARSVLRADPARWTVTSSDDVWPWDFFPTFFDYRAYFDVVLRSMQDGASDSGILVSLIRASLHYYVGHYDDPAEHFARATALNPSFAWYAYAHAWMLSSSSDRDDRIRASALLRTLMRSALFAEASTLLVTTAMTLEDSEAVRHGRAMLRRVATAVASLDHIQDEPPVGARRDPFAGGSSTPVDETWRRVAAAVGETSGHPASWRDRLARAYGRRRLGQTLRPGQPVVIFGRGSGGVTCLLECAARGVPVVGFLDNHVVPGRSFLGYPVYPVKTILDTNTLPARAVVLASMSRSHEMRAQLERLGIHIPSIEFFQWHHMTSEQLVRQVRAALFPLVSHVVDSCRRTDTR